MEKIGVVTKRTNKPEYNVKNPICWEKRNVIHRAYNLGIRSYYENITTTFEDIIIKFGYEIPFSSKEQFDLYKAKEGYMIKRHSKEDGLKIEVTISKKVK